MSESTYFSGHLECSFWFARYTHTQNRRNLPKSNVAARPLFIQRLTAHNRHEDRCVGRRIAYICRYHQLAFDTYIRCGIQPVKLGVGNRFYLSSEGTSFSFDSFVDQSSCWRQVIGVNYTHHHHHRRRLNFHVNVALPRQERHDDHVR